MKPLYITTTLPYVNAAPHIGFALEIVQADAVARYARHLGRPVFFNFGSDEHGQKIWQKAAGQGTDVQEYVDYFAAQFQNLRVSLNLSYDNFIRTTSEGHKIAAAEMWNRCLANGDIYKKSYKGLYCVGDEMFVKESDLVDGFCPNHPGQEPVEIEEENYFFRLSNYQDYLEEYLSKPGSIIPEWRRKEALNFVQNGLEDFSISRKRSRMNWGIEVPGDDEHVMYVWFDALTNYISTLGWPEDVDGNFASFWENGDAIQFAGKDQVRFQSIMWQAMLKSAGVKATDQVFYHGFINSGGQKMSKSIGNVIDPFQVVEKYGTDALRYFLLRHIHPTEDSDWTAERFHENYMASLVGGIGNLTNRILKMASSAEIRLDNKPQVDIPDTLLSYQFNDYMNGIWREVAETDKFISDEAPYKKVKEDPRSADDDFRYLLEKLYAIAVKLKFAMPETSAKILDAIKKNEKPENPIFPRVELN